MAEKPDQRDRTPPSFSLYSIQEKINQLVEGLHQVREVARDGPGRRRRVVKLLQTDPRSLAGSRSWRLLRSQQRARRKAGPRLYSDDLSVSVHLGGRATSSRTFGFNSRGCTISNSGLDAHQPRRGRRQGAQDVAAMPKRPRRASASSFTPVQKPVRRSSASVSLSFTLHKAEETPLPEDEGALRPRSRLRGRSASRGRR